MERWQTPQSSHNANPVRRTRVLYVFILAIFAIFTIRLFYVQVINYAHYAELASNDQVREYEVMPERGNIYAQLNGETVALVLNEKLYTIFGDPTLVRDADETAKDIAPLLSMSERAVRDALETDDTSYVVLKKRVSEETKDKILALKYPGVASQQINYRVYPQGTMASQVLGFVNEDGEGKYGVEQALDETLAGQRGQLKAITDVNGVPLAVSSENLLIAPKAGSDVALTVDIGMQAQLEQIVKAAKDKFNSKNVSAIVLETNTGAVKAMANYPTFDPAKYQDVEDGALFQNYAVATPIEPGSITKILTVAAGINEGDITKNSTYYDPGVWTIDQAKILNVAEGEGQGTQSIATLLNLSLNTGATWVFQRMGGGEINMTARQTLYDYFVDHYRLSKLTGIEQGYEATGYIPEPDDNGAGINLTYANMSFGQAYSATALQMAAAMSAIVNGGTYYQPHLVASTTTADGTETSKDTKVVQKNVVTTKTSSDIRDLLQYVTDEHARGFSYMNFPSQYSVGGKTGTAQITDTSTGLYREDVFNGTFMGYVGGDMPQYTIIVYNIQPKTYYGFAGSQTGQPIFADIAHMLINNYGVTPKSN